MSVVAEQNYYYATNQEEKTPPSPPSPLSLVKVLRIAHQTLHSHCLQSIAQDSSSLSVGVHVLGLLLLNLLFVLLSSCGGLLCSCFSFASPLGVDSCSSLQQRRDRKFLPSGDLTKVLRARLLQTCVMQARPPVRQLPLCLVASLSPALSLCVSASLSFPSLPPASFALSVLH